MMEMVLPLIVVLVAVMWWRSIPRVAGPACCGHMTELHDEETGCVAAVDPEGRIGCGCMGDKETVRG